MHDLQSNEPERVEPMELTDLIERAPWREAITFRHTWPHEYVLLQKDHQRELLEAVCERFRNNVAANIKPQVVEMFSKMVNNAAEHGMSDTGAHCHVRLMPHRRGLAFDSVITDRGPGIRATLERNPDLQVESDEQALRLAVQELTSGTGNPTRGIGLWTTFLECQKPGRKLQVHSGTGRLTVYGPDSVEFSTTLEHQGTTVRFTIPT